MKTFKKILIAPDKFKFTLSAFQVCEAISKATDEFENYLHYKLPVSDGGEGTSDILSVYIDAKPIQIKVNDPLFRIFEAEYYYSDRKKTALIDMAAASGLQLLSKKDQNPMNTSTFGTGEMIRDAVNRGTEKILLGLGGSATNDAALGAAEALGYEFLDKKGKQLKPTGRNLNKVQKIKKNTFFPDLRNIKIELLYDVENQLYGKTGAALIYSKQKGANNREVKLLDKGLQHISQIFNNEFDIDVSLIKGGGTAGGFGAGATAMFGAELKPGAETVMHIASFEKHLSDTDLIITGEGKFDGQSFQGKITGKIIEKANERNIPVVVICGRADIKSSKIKYKNILSVLPLFDKDIDIKTAKVISSNMITKTTRLLLKNLQLL